MRVEYKTIIVPAAYSKKQVLEIESILNEEAKLGWELQIMIPQSLAGGTKHNLAIFKK